MNVVIKRTSQSAEGTFGVMLVNGLPVCVTCERPWLDNHPMTSCIPAGGYHCTQHSSPKFGDVWELQNVPGRTAILIHPGNWPSDSEGCILVGSTLGKLDDKPAILGAKSTINMLRTILPPSFDLTIIVV